MKQTIKKLIALTIITGTVLGLNPIGASAQWVQDDSGWWNSEGNTWTVGWKNIDSKWYYFNQNGYMQTGWLNDGGNWYYLNANGEMALNTTIDGHNIDSEGVWTVLSADNTNITPQVSLKNTSKTNSVGSSSSESTGKTTEYISIFYFLENGNIDSVCEGKQTLAFYSDIENPSKTYGLLLINKADYGFTKQDLIKIIPNYKVVDDSNDNKKLIEKV